MADKIHLYQDVATWVESEIAYAVVAFLPQDTVYSMKSAYDYTRSYLHSVMGTYDNVSIQCMLISLRLWQSSHCLSAGEVNLEDKGKVDWE